MTTDIYCIFSANCGFYSDIATMVLSMYWDGLAFACVCVCVCVSSIALNDCVLCLTEKIN